MPPRVWFITGTLAGFGQICAEAALARGDKVAAAGRETALFTHLAARYGKNVLPMRVDVTDRSAVDAAVARAHERFGRLDVVVSNACHVIEAALPYLRKQRSGCIFHVDDQADRCHPQWAELSQLAHGAGRNGRR